MALSPKRYWRKLAALAKIETDYGADALPTGAANAIQFSEVTLTPMAGEEARRDLMAAHFGNQGVMLVGDYVELKFSVELAGSGAAGTAPAYGMLLRACGLAETIVADTSVAYEPASSDLEATTLYANLDGVNHKMLGARGTFTLNLTPKQIPRIAFSLRGLLGPVADAPLPAANYAAYQTPLPVTTANTPVHTLHGYAAIAESYEMDIANTVEVRNLIGEDSIQISDRQSTGTMVVEATSLATKDWFAVARAGTKGALALQHGTVAGNIVEIAAPKVQIGRPTYGQTQGITNLSLPLLFTPDAGDDEYVFTFR
ncbi:phage tail tube protein [Castellaniella sp.]|uniref:phage tail tube protein n=1 Tax=Castellaniella sp. TaxID=1955812 RepID=UPI002AFE29B2|nr:phage tail tube protein [Castellaniella sp.]